MIENRPNRVFKLLTISSIEAWNKSSTSLGGSCPLVCANGRMVLINGSCVAPHRLHQLSSSQRSVEVNPAIHFDDFTRHEIGSIATDEDRNSSNLIGLRKSPQWRSLCDITDQLVSPAFRHFCHC
jgi:hypothetical protein